MEKEILIAKRKQFFDNILEVLKKPPSSIDMILQQDKYYVAPNLTKLTSVPESGDLAIFINGKFHEKEFNIYYTIWQLGDILKIGVAIYDQDLHGAFASDHHNEVFYIWGNKNDPRIDVAHGCVFYDWEFEVKELYDNYRNQERFILGVRHMHFRVMRIIHDECLRLLASKNEKFLSSSDDAPFNFQND